MVSGPWLCIQDISKRNEILFGALSKTFKKSFKITVPRTVIIEAFSSRKRDSRRYMTHIHDGIPWSPWWHTLKTMMVFLEDHDGKKKRVEFLKKLNYELISQNTSWKELIKERVVFPKYATRQSWTIGQGQYWRKKK